MANKQTAVGHLEQQLVEYIYMCIIESTDKDNRYVKIDTLRLNAMFNKAKEIEKEQMSELYNEGLYQDINSDTLLPFEQYYNETFKSE